MVFGILKKLFGGETDQSTASATSAKASPVDKKASAESADLAGFVDYVVRCLVNEPDAVQVTSTGSGNSCSLQISCQKSDVAKIIGKNGRTISAIRLLVNGAANRDGQQVKVDVLD